MPADTLSREEIERLRAAIMTPTIIKTDVMLRVIDHALSEPTRLAQARAEGYREGIEAAIADAVAVSIRDEVDSYEMRDDGGGGYSPTDDERIMLEDFGAGLVAVFEQRLRALTPPPAEPTSGTAEPVQTNDDFEAFKAADDGLDMTYEVGELLSCPFCGGVPGYAHGEDEHGRFVAVGCSKCGAGSRQHYPLMDDAKPHAAGAWNQRVPDKRITALKAENEKLRDVVAAVVKASEGITLGRGEADHEDWTLYLKIGDLRRARALLQGGSDAG